MNIRYAVICERLRLRHGAAFTPVTTEEQLQATERSLGFRLPAMLRTLYLQVGNGAGGTFFGLTLFGARPAWMAQGADFLSGHNPVLASPLSDLEEHNLLGGPPLTAELVEALQRYVGSYFVWDWDDDDVADEEPSGVLQLGFGQPNLLLDGHTGCLYYSNANEESVDISFCAPSVEDWLETKLDAPLHLQVRHFPHTELTALLQAEEHGTTSVPRRETLPDTAALRSENLSGAPNPDDYHDKLARMGARPVYASDETVRQTGLQLERERHELLRQLYRLMDLFEAGQETDAEHQVGVETFLEGLRPLLEADAHLASLAEKISTGMSELYARHWDPNNLQYKLRHRRK